MADKKKQTKDKFNFTKLIGYLVVGSFCMFLASFIYQAINVESTDATQRWCENCQVFHDINDETVDEIWCNNCQTWHAPNQESGTKKIN
tara:strand:+ start:115 stop:381 length:267 start_codon:yes stop_codon:yes gene_type:complete